MAIYYSKDNEIIDSKNFKHFYYSRVSNIYVNDDVVFKAYHSNTPYIYHMRRKMFKKFKKYNIPNVVKLIDYYHSFSSRIGKMLPMDAYTMNYIKEDKVNLIDMDRLYLNDIIKQCEETLRELSNKHILIKDMHEDNILFTENGINLIDLDQYTENKLLPKSYIYQLNKEEIIHAINCTIICECIKNKKTLYMKKIKNNMNTTFTEDFLSFLSEDTIQNSIKAYALKL